MEANYFLELSAVNCADKIEKKNNLSYLSWAYAWSELKKLHPTAFYTVYENAQGWNYHTDGRTAWVKTGVSVEVDGKWIEHIEYLPVMDYKNRSIPAEQLTSFDVNKAIQRSLTKAVARHGLGLYIYAGEDLPEAEKDQRQDNSSQFQHVTSIKPTFCDRCSQEILPVRKRDGSTWETQDMVEYAKKRYGYALCAQCMKQAAKNEGA